MFELTTNQVFYGKGIYEMQLLSSFPKMKTITEAPSKESIACMLSQIVCLTEEEALSRVKITHRKEFRSEINNFYIPEQIVAYGNGFNITWSKVQEK